MGADRVNTFRDRDSPTWNYMRGLQGTWSDSDSQDKGVAMYIWILEEKIYESKTAT